jgi:hypothetical protein
MSFIHNVTSWSNTAEVDLPVNPTFYVYLVTEKSVVKKYRGCKWNDKMSFFRKVDLLVNQN